MSIPFMSDVSLKSLNEKTVYIRTQEEFDKVIDAMCIASAPQPYTHIVIYPNSDADNREYYAPGTDLEDGWHQRIGFQPKTHCLIEGIGKPIIRARGMTTTTTTGTISLKGLDIRVEPHEEGDHSILENFSKIEDCDIFISISGSLLSSTTAGLFNLCNNINNITIESNRSLLNFILFYQCNGLSNIKEVLTTPPPSYHRYVNCNQVSSSCPGAVIYGVGETWGYNNSSVKSYSMYHQYCIDYSTRTVTFNSLQQRGSESQLSALGVDASVAAVVPLSQSNAPSFPSLTTGALTNMLDMPDTIFADYVDNTVVGYCFRTNDTSAVAEIKYKNTGSSKKILIVSRVLGAGPCTFHFAGKF